MGKEREDGGEAASNITLSPLRFARFRPQPQIFKEDESVSHKTSLPLTMASFTSAPLAIATLLIVTVHLVPAAPIPTEQQGKHLLHHYCRTVSKRLISMTSLIELVFRHLWLLQLRQENSVKRVSTIPGPSRKTHRRFQLSRARRRTWPHIWVRHLLLLRQDSDSHRRHWRPETRWILKDWWRTSTLQDQQQLRFSV